MVERLGPVQEKQTREPDRSENDNNTRLGGVIDSLTENPSLSGAQEVGTETDNNKLAASDTHSVINKDENLQASGDPNQKIEMAVDQTKSLSCSEEPLEGEIIPADCLEEDSGEDSESDNDDDESDDDDDDDEGWITPSNIKAVKEKMGMMDSEKTNVPVGCLTTDFSIQVCLVPQFLSKNFLFLFSYEIRFSLPDILKKIGSVL